MLVYFASGSTPSQGKGLEPLSSGAGAACNAVSEPGPRVYHEDTLLLLVSDVRDHEGIERNPLWSASWLGGLPTVNLHPHTRSQQHHDCK